MRQADIVVNEVEYACETRSGLAKVRVVEKGLKLHGWESNVNAVRVEYVAGHPFVGTITLLSRNVEPWDARHESRLVREAENAEREARVLRVAERLGIIAVPAYSTWVRVFEEDFFKFAERLGVETD